MDRPVRGFGGQRGFDGGDPPGADTHVSIARRMSENDLARGLADALNTVVGPDYEADRDAGEHVKLRKKTLGTGGGPRPGS